MEYWGLMGACFNLPSDSGKSSEVWVSKYAQWKEMISKHFETSSQNSK